MTGVTAAAPVLRAVLWMTMTLAMFALMMVAVRELAQVMSTFEILAFRSVVALVILLPVAVYLGRAAYATRRLRLHVARNAVHFVAQYGWIVGIALLPLAEVTALEFTTPAWAALLAALFLGERIGDSAGRFPAPAGDCTDRRRSMGSCWPAPR